MFDITWGGVIKLTIVSLGTYTGTYVIKPVMLIVRDKILWWYINKYILNKELMEKINRRAHLATNWNNMFAGSTTVMFKDGKITYIVKGNKVTYKEYTKHLNTMDIAMENLNELYLHIEKKYISLDKLLKYYGQDMPNPIKKLVKTSMERFKKT